MLVFHMSVLSPRVVVADAGTGYGGPTPCAGAAHHDASEPCPGCPEFRCTNTECASLCVAAAVVPMIAPAGVSIATVEHPTAAVLLQPADLTQPPLHPPPIL